MEATLRPPFDLLLRDILDPMIPDPVLLGVLRSVSDENCRARDLAPLVRQDLGYRQYLFAQTFLSERLKEWLSENEARANRDLLLLERILGLLGKAPVRNLIACARIERLLGESEALGVDEKIVVTPVTLLPFAVEAERICQDEGWLGPGEAFAAGFHYDCLAALAGKRGASPEDRAAVGAAFKEGLSLGRAAYELGHGVREIDQGDRLFAAGLLLPIGKAVMAALFPKSAGAGAWIEFLKSCTAGEYSAELLLLRERRRFPVTHWEIGSLIASFGVVLQDLEKPIFFFSDPDRLKRTDPAHYPLCALLSVVVRRAGGGARRLEGYQHRWLKDNGIE
jgi:hypothetical protein